MSTHIAKINLFIVFDAGFGETSINHFFFGLGKSNDEAIRKAEKKAKNYLEMQKRYILKWEIEGIRIEHF